jgi:hypothetical protein
VGDDAATLEEISQHNQRARRDRSIKDHHGGVLAVRKLHRAETIAGSIEPRRFHVEGKETVTREALFKTVKRDGREPLGASHTRTTFP